MAANLTRMGGLAHLNDQLNDQPLFIPVQSPAISDGDGSRSESMLLFSKKKAGQKNLQV